MMATDVVHGTLNATVIQSRSLISRLHGFFAKVFVKMLRIFAIDRGHYQLYTTIDFGLARVARTGVVSLNPRNPVWNESFRIYCAYTNCEYVVVSVKNQLPVSAQVMGRARIPVSQILRGKVIEDWYDLYNENFSEKLKSAQIRVRLHFSHVTEDPHWGTGIRDKDFPGVQDAYFKQRKDCRVTLYQNSHLSEQFRPKIELDGGGLYSPPRLWEEMYEYINGARKFIYITGWSVYTEITLVRDRERMIKGAQGVTIGELLKKKAEQGVTVLVLIWEDRTAVRILNKEGLMKTHCDETFEYFKDSKVHCALCPRNPDKRSLSLIQGVEVGAQFTHHQKTVSLDSAVADDSKTCRVVSFVGGIDLCDGRYDTETHTLFGDLYSVFKDDFVQNNFEGADLRHGGPREPWHDAHSKIQGPAAWDVIKNFTERWTKQADPSLLLDLEHLPNLILPEQEDLGGPESWNVQIFRSIDDGSVVGFPQDPSPGLGLVTIKDQVVDKSIHSAYVEAIRRAKNFIFIENQYFLGSSASWAKDQDCGCLHLVPIELALKIVSKIRAKERFAVYVVTPMWPEGFPDGDTVQAILHWHRNTVEMMYKLIGEALKEQKSKAHPTDYLNFFCLGNRETMKPGEYVAPEAPEQGSNYWNAQTNRRFMIYVHAKLMIVDDEYLVVGSANLNQRSMDGARDTEIAQGCYQPQHINNGGRARGEIHGYRMSLWYEHTRVLKPEYLKPESVKCVRTVREIAKKAWDAFVGKTIVDIPAHLLTYPVQVHNDGSVTDLNDYKLFPDSQAPIAGKKSDVIPPILTT
ncbi:hypothetical protein SUGI_0996540 [Cryptomeria japonica]|uniref:phospholipase D alpha 1 n=1 Tax=Cryptomeria japonica TaxID=3369 RepID=UPI0024147082|nr:phospholipase D alpha 1 [Cryptomeria japonica]GLJ47212.1 hypothetical protein SUGI_0996540 [Cryptomeria japonica]